MNVLGKRKVLTEKDIKNTPLPDSNVGQMFGIVKGLLGNDKIQALCDDKKVRVCRIKGTLRRRVWIRLNDVVIVELWGFQDDTRADIVGRYTRGQKEWLIQNGHIEDWLL